MQNRSDHQVQRYRALRRTNGSQTLPKSQSANAIDSLMLFAHVSSPAIHYQYLGLSTEQAHIGIRLLRGEA